MFWLSKLAASNFKTTLALLLEEELLEEELLDEELLELEDELPEEDELEEEDEELLDDEELDDEDELLDVPVGAKTQPAVLDSPVAWTWQIGWLVPGKQWNSSFNVQSGINPGQQ